MPQIWNRWDRRLGASLLSAFTGPAAPAAAPAPAPAPTDPAPGAAPRRTLAHSTSRARRSASVFSPSDARSTASRERPPAITSRAMASTTSRTSPRNFIRRRVFSTRPTTIFRVKVTIRTAAATASTEIISSPSAQFITELLERFGALGNLATLAVNSAAPLPQHFDASPLVSDQAPDVG